MNILLVCYEYPPLGGGGGVGASQYAEAWARQKHRVTVLTGHAAGLPRRTTVNGVDVIRVASPGRFDRATSSFISMAFYNLTAVLYALLHRRDLCERSDVINTHFSIPTGPAAAVIAWWLVLPNVLTIIGGDIYDPSKRSSPHRSTLMRRLNRWIIGRADHVIAISSDT
jgi:glycosyltransferase involved in cell wall biosynthesis